MEGGELLKGTSGPAVDLDRTPFPPVPEPVLPSLDKPWSILVTGIGGTGVVTIGHLLGMAAHIEGKGAALIDMVGISQKNGTVVTHIKIGASPEDISAVRVARGAADLILGCDLVTSASERILAAASRAKTHAVINSHEVMPSNFTHDANFDVQGQALSLRIAAAVKQRGFSAIDATDIATRLMGDSIAANLFTLGFAWQKGLVPLARESIEEAVQLNAVSVKMNLAAFAWGRRAAVDEAAVRAVIGAKVDNKVETLEEVIARRAEFLTAYQDAAYAASYRDIVAKVRSVSEPLALYTDGSFAEKLSKQFTGDFKLKFHLAPPIRGRTDSFTGKPVKSEYGPWMMGAFRLLAMMKRLRGTSLDVFGRTAERRMERQLIADYRALVDRLIASPERARSRVALELANLPDMIRGFGHVKEANLAKAKAREAELLATLEDAGAVQKAAE